MPCFIALTLALRMIAPAPPVYINRERITLVMAAVPAPERPSTHALVGVEGRGVLYVAERPHDVMAAPCAAPSDPR